ncbi:MAG: hypothetical protein GKS00_15585 [Alphaproteobacteria bacterium]|nr:hypothetical protein [Alphaproteobacteria bacterium]
MTGDSMAERREKKSIGGDLVIPVAALVFTLYYFSTILDSPWTAQVSAFFVGAILIALIAAFLVKSARQIIRKEASWHFDTLVSPPGLVLRRLLLLVLTLAYIALIEWGGFTLTSFGFLFLAMLLLGGGRNFRLALLLSVSLSLVGYLLFIVAFETRFPVGPFEALMKPLF